MRLEYYMQPEDCSYYGKKQHVNPEENDITMIDTTSKKQSIK